MRNSLRQLLTAALDYAGMFPPAKLPLAEAWANFVDCRQADESWLLRSFVCPAERLAELAEIRSVDEAGELYVSVIGPGFDEPAAAEASLERSFLAMAEFLRASRTKANNDLRLSLEVNCPPETFRSPGGVSERCEQIRQSATSAGISLDGVFLEVPWQIDPAEAAGDLAGFLRPTSGEFGLKFRTGGLDAASFPSSAQLAAAIVACRDAGVAWKATAGLHHPLPREDPVIGVRMHGFLNVFAAAVLAATHDLTAGEAAEVLDDDSPQAFHFDDQRLRWRGKSATLERIAFVRRTACVSFGSCSFHEPVQDLRKLALL